MAKTMSAKEVAKAWKWWCGSCAWTKAMEAFGKIGGRVRWWAGYPRSASAIPLCFTLILSEGQEINGSRLKDIKEAIAKESIKRGNK